MTHPVVQHAHDNPTTTVHGVVLNTAKLVVQYGDITALTLNDFRISGNIISIIGHNGSGKSTLLKSILRLSPVTQGHLDAYFCDTILIPERDMFFSPENGSVFSDIDVESYLKLWCRLRRRSLQEPKAQQLLERLDIGSLKRRLGRELSKGQRRRVQTAIGFLFEPRLFIFDEPFDGLDIEQSHILSELMLEYADRTSVVLASHRMDVVERLSDQIIVLDHGELVAAGNAEQVSRSLFAKSELLQQSTMNGNVADYKKGTLSDSLNFHLKVKRNGTIKDYQPKM